MWRPTTFSMIIHLLKKKGTWKTIESNHFLIMKKLWPEIQTSQFLPPNSYVHGIAIPAQILKYCCLTVFSTVIIHSKTKKIQSKSGLLRRNFLFSCQCIVQELVVWKSWKTTSYSYLYASNLRIITDIKQRIKKVGPAADWRLTSFASC